MTASELEVMDELAEYMAYCFISRGSWYMTMTGKLIALHFFL